MEIVHVCLVGLENKEHEVKAPTVLGALLTLAVLRAIIEKERDDPDLQRLVGGETPQNFEFCDDEGNPIPSHYETRFLASKRQTIRARQDLAPERQIVAKTNHFSKYLITAAVGILG